MVHRGCPFVLLLRLFLNLIISVTSSGIRSIATVRFNPSSIHDLMAGSNRSVELSLDLDTRHSEFTKLPPGKPFTIILKSVDEEIAETAKKRRQFELNEYSVNNSSFQTYKLNFTVIGRFLGKTTIKVGILSADEVLRNSDLSLYEIAKEENDFYENNFLDVWVIQDNKRLVNRIFLSALVILIVIANVLMGCELDINVVLETIKNPVAPMIGFCTQFIAMPLLAYAIANVIFTANGLHSFALGLFVTGCAPGGGASNYWTILLNGNLPVSVTMTFFSTLAALGMIPFWMWLLGFHFIRSFHPEAVIKVPYFKIITSLVTMIVPLLFGVLVSHFMPQMRCKARKVMRPFIVFSVVVLIGFGIIANIYMIRLLTWTAFIGSLLLPWCGFSIGCFSAILLRQPPSTVTAIAIETGIQNTGIAIMLLKFSFPDPDADISALVPVIVASVTPIPLLFVMTLHCAWKTLRKGQTKSKSNNLDAMEAKSNPLVENCKDDAAVPNKIKVKEDNPLMSDGKLNV